MAGSAPSLVDRRICRSYFETVYSDRGDDRRRTSGVVLQRFYEARLGGEFVSVPVDPSCGLDEATARHIANHLKQLGLIELFSPLKETASGRITAHGVNVVEGRVVASALGITVIDNRIAVSGSSNTLNVTNAPDVTQKTVSATDHSTISGAEKAKENSWLWTLLRQIPWVGKIIDRVFKLGA